MKPMLTNMITKDRLLQFIMIILSGILLGVMLKLFAGFTIDDSFIAYRYADNFAAGNGLVFNLGERVEAYSTFLWVFMLGMSKYLGIDVIIASKVLGVLSLITVLILCYSMSFKLTKDRIFATGIVCFLASSFSLVYFAVTGMETIFYTALLTCCSYVFYKNKCRVTLMSGVISVLITLTRPEGILYFPMLIIIDLIRNKTISKRMLTSAGLFVVCCIAFVLWRYNYYGEVVPNTFYAKPPIGSYTSLPPIISCFDDIYRYVVFIGGPLLVVLFAFSILKRGLRNELYFLFPALPMIILFQLYSGGDWMERYRYLVPTVPFYLIIGFYGLWWILKTITLKRSVVYFSIFMFLGLVNIGESINFYWNRQKYPNFVMTSEDMISTGKWIGERYPANYKIASGRIGALAYYSGLNLIDADWGITDKYVAKMRFGGKWIGEEREKYLYKLNPELITTPIQDHYELKKNVKIKDRKYSQREVFRQGSNSWLVLYERDDLSM